MVIMIMMTQDSRLLSHQRNEVSVMMMMMIIVIRSVSSSGIMLFVLWIIVLLSYDIYIITIHHRHRCHRYYS